MIIYPSPIKTGSVVGITAPSSGVDSKLHERLNLAELNLKNKGFEILEGNCLRSDFKQVSGSPEMRAADLMRLWNDPEVSFIYPPWGGSLLVEILPLLDFDQIKNSPKWILGYSDISTLLLPITTLTDIATAHGTNLFDSVSSQSDPLTLNALQFLNLNKGDIFEQKSSELWQKEWPDLQKNFNCAYHLTEKTEWKILKKTDHCVEFSGRLIGGCLDSLAALTGTRFGAVPEFSHRYKNDKTIIYLENCEQDPYALCRILWNFKMAGWFKHTTGIVFGRNAKSDSGKADDLTYVEAIENVLGNLNIPIVLDADIGNMPPQMTLINGALATVRCENGRGLVKQKLV